ncbi:MAG: hypothetical protein ACFBWO_15255 [Paracoccaceae bacterium]
MRAVAWWVAWLAAMALVGLPAALWFALSLAAIETRHPVHAVERIAVEAPLGTAVTIGRAMLGQREGADSAVPGHLRAERRRDGWWLANIAPDRRALLLHRREGETRERYMRHWILRPGDTVTVEAARHAAPDPPRARALSLVAARAASPGEGAVTVTVLDAADGALRLAVAGYGAVRRYDIRHRAGRDARVEALAPDDARWLSAPACGLEAPGAPDLAVAELARRLGAHRRGTLATLGGRVSCRDRIALPSGTAGALALHWTGEAHALVVPGALAGRVSLARAGGPATRADALAWPLGAGAPAPALGAPAGEVVGIVLGRTRNAVSTAGEALRLAPVADEHLFFDGPGRDAPRDVFSLAYLRCLTRTAAAADCPMPPIAVPPGARVAVGTAPRDRATPADLAAALPPWMGLMPSVAVAGTLLGVVAALAGRRAVSFAPLRAVRGVLAALAGAGARRAGTLATAAEGALRFALIAVAGLIAAGAALERGTLVEAPRVQATLLVAAAWLALFGAVAIETAEAAARRSARRLVAGALFWTAAGAVMLLGALVQQQLSRGGLRGAWTAFDLAHHAILASCLALLALCLLVPRRLVRGAAARALFGDERLWYRLRVGTLAAILAGGLALALTRTEAGLAGRFEPIELGKGLSVVFALAILCYYQRASGYAAALGRRALLSFLLGLAGLGLFAAVVFLAIPVRLNDWSPIVVMALATAATMAFALSTIAALRLDTALRLGRSRLPSTALPRPQARLRLRPDPEFPPSRRSRERARRLRWLRWQQAVREFPHASVSWLLAAGLVLAAVVVALFVRDVERERTRTDAPVAFSTAEKRVAVWLEWLEPDDQGAARDHLEWSGQMLQGWEAFTHGGEAGGCEVLAGPAPAATGLGGWLAPVCPPAPASVDGRAPDPTARPEKTALAAPSPEDGRAPGAAGPVFNGSKLMRVPAIQDDLIGVFVIARFGTGALALLVTAQAAVVILGVAAALMASRTHAGDLRDERERLLVASLAFGGAALLAVQWTIAWCNVFGWLPVMGQPMTFVSYANSHMLAVGLPCLVAIHYALRLGPPSPAPARHAEPDAPPRDLRAGPPSRPRRAS